MEVFRFWGTILKCEDRILQFVQRRPRARLTFSRRTPMQIGSLPQREGTTIHDVISFSCITRGSRNRVDGTWVMFTGNQLGTLFAARILEQYKASGKPLGKPRTLSILARGSRQVFAPTMKWCRQTVHGGIRRELQNDRSYGSSRRIQVRRMSHWFGIRLAGHTFS